MSDNKAALQALQGTGSRAKIMDAQMVFKLPSQVKELINKSAKDQGISDATVMRVALAEYFERRGYRA